MRTISSHVLALFLAFLALGAQAAPFAYITESSGNLSLIDVEGHRVARTLALGGSPHGVAVQPVGRRAYVTKTAAAEVAVIDTLAQAVIANIAVPPAPGPIVMNPDATRVYLLHLAPATGDALLTAINTENNQVAASVPVRAGSRLAMNPLGTRLYVANTSAASVTVLDAATLNVLARINTAPGPLGMAVDPSGQRLYVAHFGTDAVAGDTVSVIDLASGTVAGSIRVGFRPDSIVFHPSGARLYVTNRNSDSVSVIDAGSANVVATIPVGAGPTGIDIAPAADFVYVANQNASTVSVLRADPPGAFHTVPVGAGPLAIGRFFGGGPTSSAPAAPGILTGLWWNPAESGWGIHLTQRRNTVFAAWFTYDSAGAPKWYVASNCNFQQPITCPTCVDDAFCTGNLYEVNGPPRYFGTPFDARQVQAREVGVLQIEFRNRDRAKMSYAVGTRSRTLDISRQPIQATGSVPSTDYTDLWWNPSESGWGLGITHQFGVMFLTWFVYDEIGRPTWYVASDCSVVAGGNGCRGTLYRTSGPPGPTASDTFDSSRVRVTAVGSVDVAFTDGNTGVITYTVDGVSGSKTITRQIF